MKEILHSLDNRIIRFKLHGEIYEREAIMQASYRFTDKCAVFVTSTEPNIIEAILEPKSTLSDEQLNGIANEFCNEVLDQQIRSDLEKRFGKIREIIVRHAFSPLEDLETELKKR